MSFKDARNPFAMAVAIARWLPLAFLLALCPLSFGQPVGAAPRSTPESQNGIDSLGDPLPPGARMRLGTLRHRNVFWDSRTQHLPGDKTMLLSTAEEVRWVDVESGRVTQAWPLPKEQLVCGFAPDGRRAILMDKTALHLWDLTTRKELQTLKANEKQLFGPADAWLGGQGQHHAAPPRRVRGRLR